MWWLAFATSLIGLLARLFLKRAAGLWWYLVAIPLSTVLAAWGFVGYGLAHSRW